MKNLSKLLLLLILPMTILLGSPLLNAANDIYNLSDSEYNQLVSQYIQDILSLRDQAFSLSQMILSDPPQDEATILASMESLNTQVDNLTLSILNHLANVPSDSYHNRDASLALSSLSLIKSSLYQLRLLKESTNTAESYLLLEDFYLLRRSALEPLVILDTLIKRE
jgi:hypothetical protein